MSRTEGYAENTPFATRASVPGRKPLASIDAVSCFERVHDVASGRFEGLFRDLAVRLGGRSWDCRQDLPAAVAFISIGH
jgi:hypothetical protein